MQTTVIVINPINNEEIEVNLDINTSVHITNESKVIQVTAFGVKELP
jgi:hypothetical protein